MEKPLGALETPLCRSLPSETAGGPLEVTGKAVGPPGGVSIVQKTRQRPTEKEKQKLNKGKIKQK